MQFMMKNAPRLCRLALLAMACGCHAVSHPPAMKPTPCVCAPHGPCAGYFSTCWRQWPSQCPSCPPAIEGNEMALPPNTETILPPAPVAGEAPYDSASNAPKGRTIKQSSLRTPAKPVSKASRPAKQTDPQPQPTASRTEQRPAASTSPRPDNRTTVRIKTAKQTQATQVQTKPAQTKQVRKSSSDSIPSKPVFLKYSADD